MSKQVKNTVAVLAFFDQQKGSVTSNKNKINRAIYTAKRVRLIVRVINFQSTFAKNGQSNLVLVLVLVLESQVPNRELRNDDGYGSESGT